MAIYSPEIYLSETDKELLALLAELLLDAQNINFGSNRESDDAVLTDKEAHRLITLLEKFVDSRKFREGSYFIEALVGANSDEKAAREIYLSWRTRYGRTRAVATVQWENFLARAGLLPLNHSDLRVWYRANARPMDFEHFLKMERKLATSAGLSPRVRNLILEFVEARRFAIQGIQKRQTTLPSKAAEREPRTLLNQLTEDAQTRLGHAPMSSQRISAVMTIVLDFSTMFTTRDWSVAGFISTIAGSIPASMVNK